MPAGDFLEFHIIINRVPEVDEASYVAVVADAPVSRFGYRFDRLGRIDRLKERLGKDAKVSLRGGSRARMEIVDRELHPGTEQRALRSVGEALFDTLFPEGSSAYNLLGQSCLLANQDGCFLRLKLELHPDLSDLPWENMRPPRTGPQAVTMNQAKMSIVRYMGKINIRAAQPAAAKPHILVIKSDPTDSHQAELTSSFFSERIGVENVLRELSEELAYEVFDKTADEFHDYDTVGWLTDRVQELEAAGHPVVGLHFIGHGHIDDQGGYLVGETRERGSLRIYEEELRTALEPAERLRWVLFNACSTAGPVGCPLAGLSTSISILKNVPTVIAYRRPVQTAEAEKLAADFYTQCVKGGRPVDEMIRSFQSRLRNPGGLVLLLRSVEGRIDTNLRAAPPPAPGPRPARPAPRSPTSRPPARNALGPMVKVPAGPFPKGLTGTQIGQVVSQFKHAGLALDLDSARQVLAKEKYQSVSLTAFEIDITPVTVKQFRRFVKATGHQTDAEKANAREVWHLHDTPEMQDNPVVFVSYRDCQAYCRWAGKRLPTADEWKKAYRGEEGRIYPWGDTFDETLCNSAESRRRKTTPVTMFPGGASPFGCLDMVGNVEEWTSSEGPRDSKTVLGGSWSMTCLVYGLPVLRRFAPPNFYSNETGFRCVRS